MSSTGSLPDLASDELTWRGFWVDALDAVELDVRAAEDLLARLHGAQDDEDLPEAGSLPWSAPDLVGPLPLEFADRARRLLRRQLEVSERLAEAMVQLRAQRRAMSKMSRAEPPPVYYDKPL